MACKLCRRRGPFFRCPSCSVKLPKAVVETFAWAAAVGFEWPDVRIGALPPPPRAGVIEVASSPSLLSSTPTRPLLRRIFQRVR